MRKGQEAWKDEGTSEMGGSASAGAPSRFVGGPPCSAFCLQPVGTCSVGVDVG